MVPEIEFSSMTPQLTLYRRRETLHIIPHVQCRIRRYEGTSIQILPVISPSAHQTFVTVE